jgi:glycolate oxidase
MEQLDELCTANGAVDVLEADDRVWKVRRNCQESLRVISLVSITDDVVVPVDKVAECIKFVEEHGKKYPFKVLTLAHAGDGNLHFCLCKGDLTDEVWDTEVAKFHAEVYKYAYAIGGRLSGEHGIGAKKLPEMAVYTPAPELTMMKEIKKALDPKMILNPGKIFNI